MPGKADLDAAKMKASALDSDPLLGMAANIYDEAAMDAVRVIIMVLFTVEVGINATCRPNYGKVMLVIDLVGTLSMIIDLSTFANPLGAGSAMRAARVGSRAGRLTRQQRVVRLVRVF